MKAPPRSAFGAAPQGGAAGGPAEPDARSPLGFIVGSELHKLKWRGRRGLLENDLFIERFFERHGAALTPSHGRGFEALMALPDNDLLDLLLARREPSAELDRADVRDVLALMRTEGSTS